MQLKLTAFAMALAILVIAGCDSGGTTTASNPGQPAADTTARPTPPPPPPPAASTTPSDAAAAVTSSSAANQGNAPDTASGPVSGNERVEAKGGVGKRGHGYGTGPVATPVAAYFSTRDQIQFLQIKDAMRLFQGEHGRAPKSHEEFMEKIVHANGLSLPELPHGHKYVYDPKTAELMVERPQGAP